MNRDTETTNFWHEKMLSKSDHLARMTIKLLRDIDDDGAELLRAAANTWLDEYHAGPIGVPPIPADPAFAAPI